MAETASRQVWIGRGVFLGLAFGIMFVQLLPLDQRPTVFSPPDLLLTLALVWAARRPDFVPFVLIGLVFFLADLLFQRPPGLYAALVVIASEVIRGRARTLRETTIFGEAGMIAVAVIAIMFVNRAVLALVLTPQASQVQMILHILATLVAIPFVMGIAQFVFGVRRPVPGQFETKGFRP